MQFLEETMVVMSKNEMLDLLQEVVMSAEEYAGAAIEFKEKYGAKKVTIIGYQCYIDFETEADRLQFKLGLNYD